MLRSPASLRPTYSIPLSDAPLPDTTVENKKDRKRKRHPKGDANTEEPSPPKKQKKGKRDKQVESEDHAQPSTSVTSSETSPPVQIAFTPTDSTAAAAFLTKHSITIHTPPSLPPVVPVISFDQLQVPEALKVAFKDFNEPTPIQACAWPPALQRHDVVGIAETGRFVLSMLYALGH